MAQPHIPPSSFDGDKFVIAPRVFDVTNSTFREFYEETRFQKFTRKLRQEPLIPFGKRAALESIALTDNIIGRLWLNMLCSLSSLSLHPAG
jgi:hypothetical protein